MRSRAPGWATGLKKALESPLSCGAADDGILRRGAGSSMARLLALTKGAQLREAARQVGCVTCGSQRARFPAVDQAILSGEDMKTVLMPNSGPASQLAGSRLSLGAWLVVSSLFAFSCSRVHEATSKPVDAKSEAPSAQAKPASEKTDPGPPEPGRSAKRPEASILSSRT